MSNNLASQYITQIKELKIEQLFRDSKGNYMHPKIAMIASSGSGKSWIIREILYYLYKTRLPIATSIAPTDRLNKFYNDILPEAFIHHEYKSRIVSKTLNRQMTQIEKSEARVKKGKLPLDTRAALIMDDCMSSKHLWLKDPNILSIINEGRHYHLTFILALQYAIGIQPELRQGFNYIFLLADDIASSREKIWKHYAGVFKKLDVFESVFAQLTENFGCMVLDNTIKTTDITKKVYWFRSTETPVFKIGIRKVLKFNEERYDKNHAKKQKCLDINNIVTGKKTQDIKVMRI
jgi:hypothetical protein